MKRRLLVSFSGGETSGLMAKIIKDRVESTYDEVVYVFANTGEENEATLRFAKRCDDAFNLNLVWIEVVVSPVSGEGAKAKVVSFETASRHGEPFEAVIAKYGIPNKTQAHCTRELKERPIKAYVRDHLGWETGSYDKALGIRIDEIDRKSPNAALHRVIYPMIKPFPTTKAQVNEFWARQNWRLELKGYQGNCRWCWKKSLRKHLTIITETPEVYAFPERMEVTYAHAGPMNTGEPRRFFRENRTVADLRRLAQGAFTPAVDDARQYQIEMFDHTLDVGEGCEESCEVDFAEL